MHTRNIHLRNSKKGQTALEYVLVLMVLILPLAAGIREVLEDKDDNKKNLLTTLVKDSYGNEKSFGVIGRPYP